MLAAVVWSEPAAAQQAAPGAGPRVRQRPLILEPPPSGFGTAPAAGPRLAARPDHSGACAPAWPCRLRLFGTIERNGGVGLKGTALSW
jgi:hypothetical protein